MNHKLKAYQLIDVQSWDSKSSQIVMSPDLCNVIIARNETGKSVLFKIFYQMVFANYFWDRSQLIKRGKERGCAYFKGENNTEVVFMIYKTYQLYFMKTAEESKFRSWKQETLPEEIRQFFGWIIDYDNKIILNVLSGDMLPFIKTSLKFNASVLRPVTDSPRLQVAIDNLSGWLKEANAIKQHKLQVLELSRAQNNVVKFINVNELEERHAQVSDALVVVKALIFVDVSVSDLLITLGERPKEIVGDVTTGSVLNEAFSACNAMLNSIDAMFTLKATKPESIMVPDIQIAEEIIATDMRCRETLLALIALSSVSIPTPPEVTDLQVPTIMCECFRDISAVLENAVSVLDDSKKIGLSLRGVLASRQAIKQCEKELGICPLCGKPFETEGVIDAQCHTCP